LLARCICGRQCWAPARLDAVTPSGRDTAPRGARPRRAPEGPAASPVAPRAAPLAPRMWVGVAKDLNFFVQII